MKHFFILICFLLVSAPLLSSMARAEENRGFSLSGLFKFKKAEEKDKYLPVEEAKKDKLVLTGSAGPSMPAVPAGNIKKEVIVQSTLPPPKFQQKDNSAKTQLPPVTVSYNPKIPYMTLIFQNEFQQNLESGHMKILEKSLMDMKNGFYRGQVQIKSFSSKGQKPAIDRAQKVRSFMMSKGIKVTDLDVQAFPNANQGNTIHIFLLGES